MSPAPYPGGFLASASHIEHKAEGVAFLVSESAPGWPESRSYRSMPFPLTQRFGAVSESTHSLINFVEFLIRSLALRANLAISFDSPLHPQEKEPHPASPFF